MISFWTLFLPFFSFSLPPFVPFMFGAQGVWDGSLREMVACLGCTVLGGYYLEAFVLEASGALGIDDDCRCRDGSDLDFVSSSPGQGT